MRISTMITMLPCVGLVGCMLAGLVKGQCTGTTTITSSAEATGLSQCATFDGDVYIDSEATGTLALDGVETILGDLSCGYGVKVVSLSAEKLVTIGNELSIRNNDLLTSLRFPALKNVDSLYLSALPNLTEFGSDVGLMNVTSITIRNTKFGNLDWLKPKYVGSVTIEDNPSLNDIDLPIFNISGFFSVEHNGPSQQLSLSTLHGGYNLTISDCSSVDLSSLVYLNHSIGFFANGFKELSIPKLSLVEGNVMFWNNTAMSKLDLPALTNVSEAIVMHGNTALKSLDLPKLGRVEGEIAINGSFTSIIMPALTDVTGDINVRSTGPLDCSSLDPYDASDVFKGQYHCTGTAASSTSSGPATSSTGASTPVGGSESSSGLSGGAKGGIAAGVIIGVLLLALGAFFVLRRRKRSSTVNPDDDLKEAGSTIPGAPKGDTHERSALMGGDSPGDTPELPTNNAQKGSNYLPPHTVEKKAELGVSEAGHITNVAELSSEPYSNPPELAGIGPRSELPSGGVSNAHEKP